MYSKTFAWAIAQPNKFLELVLRLCYDLKLISKNLFGCAIERAAEIGELLGGIKKSVVAAARDGERETHASRRRLEQQR